MNYIIEANIGIIFLYGVYVLVLGRENDFRKQRIALLSILACALIFPLIRMAPVIDTPALTVITLPEVVVGRSNSTFDFTYLIITLLVAIPTVYSAIRLYRLAKEDGRHHGSYFIIESNQNLPSWSFFNIIYIGRANELSSEDKDLIIKHEMLHGQLLHSLDMLLITLLSIVFWFNPVLWIMRRTLAKIHEFEVDSIIVTQNGVVGYSVLLAKTALAGNGFLLTHHFNQSFILKRINMINMIKNKISSWKLAGLGVAIVLYFVAVACTEPATEEKQVANLVTETGEVYEVVDDQATPANGYPAFMQELGNELSYPSSKLEGTVFVEFIVNTDGHLSDFTVKQGMDQEYNEEALKAIGKMKSWIPAKIKGSAVRTKFVLPIRFKLGD